MEKIFTTNSCDTDIETALSEQSDKIIKDQLEQLFKSIDTEINKNCFSDEETK